MALQNPNDSACFGGYRSSDSYIIGTADYNRWLNCELNNEFIGAENSGNGNGSTPNFTPTLFEGGGGNSINAVVNNITKTDTKAETATNTNNPIINTATNLTATDKIKQLAKENPILSFIAVFGITYLALKK